MKTILITGVHRGIGKAVAEKFLAEGWFVIGTSTKGTAPLKHNNLEVFKLDMLDSKSIQSFVENIKRSNKKFDVLDNNAGVSLDKGNESINIDIFRKTLEINLIGLIDLTEKLLPFINTNGHIINTSSSVGSIVEFMGNYSPSYQISKCALNMFTRQLAERLQQKNITVSSFTPGWTKTDMGGDNAPRNVSEPAEELFELVNKHIESGFFWYQGKKQNW